MAGKGKGKGKKIRQEVEQLLTKLGIPSGGSPTKGKFRKLSLILAVLQDSAKVKGSADLISSLSVDLGHADSISQTLMPNGDYLLTVRIKGLS